MRELSLSECVELISSGGVGRVAFCTPRGPRIYPVNFTVADGALVFRVSPHTELGLTLTMSPRVAFEVDGLDVEHALGWSVVAEGTAEPVADADEAVGLRESVDPKPWAEGLRRLYVVVRWDSLSGRRVGDG